VLCTPGRGQSAPDVHCAMYAQCVTCRPKPLDIWSCIAQALAGMRMLPMPMVAIPDVRLVDVNEIARFPSGVTDPTISKHKGGEGFTASKGFRMSWTAVFPQK